MLLTGNNVDKEPRKDTRTYLQQRTVRKVDFNNVDKVQMNRCAFLFGTGGDYE